MVIHGGLWVEGRESLCEEKGRRRRTYMFGEELDIPKILKWKKCFKHLINETLTASRKLI